MWRNFILSLFVIPAISHASFLHILGPQHIQKANHPIKHHQERDLGGLKCPTCEKVGCVKKASKLKCPGGTTLDVCDCCPVCAKVEDEFCGGKWNFQGRCDRGLYCQPAEQPGELADSQNPPIGRCVKHTDDYIKALAIDILTQADEALGETTSEICQPKCTADFCSKNPKAICSGVDNADQSKSCQETCQHTSCSACRFVQASPQPCPHCKKDDFGCIRKFGRCIRKQNCRRRKFPCVSKGFRPKDENGKFQCSVPDCPVD